MMSGQSASNCAAAGEWRRNAARRDPRQQRTDRPRAIDVPLGRRHTRRDVLHPPWLTPLLAWYDRHRRSLPWRAVPGEAPDPYRVWLSEVMLQQTTVTAAIPYYERFVRRFPTLEAPGRRAAGGRFWSAWAGLGYYARARNLHACARAVVALGGFPAETEQLRQLPGIGAYTATAIAAIAFGRPGVPVDGNVERVVARVMRIADPLPRAKPAIRAAADRLGTEPEAVARPSDFAQALFDLGATVCTPASARLRGLPVGGVLCRARARALPRNCRGGCRRRRVRCAMACISGCWTIGIGCCCAGALHRDCWVA